MIDFRCVESEKHTLLLIQIFELLKWSGLTRSIPLYLISI